eukprot:7326529-Prymnesium_polylepis.1
MTLFYRALQLETWRARDDLMSSAGPPCVVVSAEALERLGRIPRFDEGESLSLPEAAKIAADSGKRFFLEMFSHRWCGRERPDDASQSKARALLEWARYRSSNGFCSFFWIGGRVAMRARDPVPPLPPPALHRASGERLPSCSQTTLASTR